MAITTGQCRSFKLECLKAIHDLSADTIKVALYTDSASLDDETTAYSATNEVSSSGYTAGGAALTLLATYPLIDASTGQAWVRFEDVTWSGVTFSARGALFYNSSKSNKAICVVDFGAILAPVNGPFVLNFGASNPPLIILS